MKTKNQLATCLLVAGIAVYSAGYAQTTPATGKTPPKETVSTAPMPLDPNVRVGKLPNGFSYYIRRNVEPKNRATLYLANKVGSILENDDQRGLAHFLEHMQFNGTKNYPKNDLVNYLQKAGVRFGADLNAYTSFDETVYQLPIPTDDPEVFKNGVQIMRDWAKGATLDPAEIEKERGVVLEEQRLGKGAQQRMQEKYLPMLFNNSRYSDRLPIGTTEVLKNFKPETIQKFYEDWYRPDLQSLIVVGDVDVDVIEKTIKEKFSDLKAPAKPAARTEYSIPLLNKNQFMVVTDKEFPVTVAQIIIKHPETVVKSEADMRASIANSLLNSMLGARYSELQKQANPPFLQGGASYGGFLAGLDAFTGVAVGKPGEFERGFKAVYTEIERAKRFGFTQTEFDRAKDAYMTSMESAYKEKDKTSSNSYVQEYLQHFLEGEASPGIEYEYNFAKKTIGGITLAEVNALTKKYITDTNRDIIIMGPEKDAATLPNEETVNKWIASVSAENIAPYIDQVSTKPLLATKPAPGKVTAEKKVAEIGVTELTLSNGVKVILKPTDFKNDEISFYAFSPGGTSLYSDADYQSAANAAAVVRLGGIGEYSSVELTKFLTGKRAGILTYISERSEGINGFASPKDLETALQLTYLSFTAPRKDPELFKGYIAQAKGNLANRESNPATVFADTVNNVLGNYNVRRTPPSVAKVDQINLDRAFSIYKERYADASDFTFTFVGSFDVEKIKPLLEQYLGSLPSTKRGEAAKDLGIYPPAGKISKTVNKGQEDKASVRLVFSGDHQYSEANNNQLDALAEVLTIKLIERLREDEGGVYGVGASASYTKYPKGRYTINISFGCAPANVEKLIASTLDEINKVKTNGALKVDIEKFVAEETRTTETSLKQNQFWMGYLVGQYQNQENPKDILGYLDSLKAITPESLKATANKYLSGSNYMRFVLLPETK